MNWPNVMDPTAFRDAVGTNDTWGIINWARDDNRAVWEACPGARKFMLMWAAANRWEACYPHTDVVHWLAFARWLAENIDKFINKFINKESPS